jgi:hypothetical protein
MRRAVLIAALVVLLSGTAEGRPPVRGLAYPGVSSPVLKQLRAQLGRDLKIARATPARLRHSRRHRLLILDGDALSPAALARRSRAIGRYMDRGGWVLALDVGPGHFTRTLDGLTRFSAAGGHPSAAFLFRDAVVRGHPTVSMLDAQGAAPAVTARLIRARVLRPTTGVGAAGRGETDVPPYLQHRTWDLTVPGQDGIGPGWWNDSRIGGGNPVLGVPPQGKQTANWTMHHTFDAYLDNATGDPRQDHQVVTYNLDGEFSPKRPDEKFAFMYEPFAIQGVGNQSRFMERAWWTGALDVSVTPDAATDGKLTLQAAAPATPDETTEYSSGDEFSVGFSASPSEPPGFETSYSVKNVTTHEVPDWGVANEGAGNALAWEWSARNGCDIRGPHYSRDACFDMTVGYGTPVLPNELSRSQLQLAASGRWRTKQQLTDSATGRLSFSIGAHAQLEDTYCATFIPVFGCSDWVPAWTTTGPAVQVYTIDVSDVVPVGIRSLVLAPDPVDGTDNEKATGTVTLDAPARIPTDVVVFSDIRNAIVGPPTPGGVTRTTVTVPTGATQATFPILTNANRLAPGDSATAQITAFYGTATTAQLRVTTKSER